MLIDFMGALVLFKTNVMVYHKTVKNSHVLNILNWCIIIFLPANLYDKTNCDWAPTINLGHDKLKPSHGATSLARYNPVYTRHTGRPSASFNNC